MFAYIPSRGGSKRIPRKNIRLLGGKSLLLHVLESLKSVRGLNEIAVSSEDTEMLSIANNCSGVTTLAPRNANLADDQTGFLELARKDIPRYAEFFHDTDILFVLPTAALVPAAIYQQAVDRFGQNRNGLVLAVRRYEQPPQLALTGDPAKSLQPLFPEMYNRPTRDLPEAFLDAGCFYLFRQQRLEGVSRFLDIQPVQGVVLSPDIGIDVDTEADWEKLEQAFLKRDSSCPN